MNGVGDVAISLFEPTSALCMTVASSKQLFLSKFELLTRKSEGL